MKIVETDLMKICRSESYNFFFNKKTGFFMRCGENVSDDPDFSPFGPEILDLEISSGGDCKGNCSFCYKCNGGDQPTHNMTIEEFKIILSKMPNVLTQIAFGIMDVQTNPDFVKMLWYARHKGIIPNYTTHGLDVTDLVASYTSKLCGAVAVSLVNKKKTFEAIRKFLSRGMKQVNIHYMLSEETYDRAFEIVEEVANDKTLKEFNAIVFLQYKAKGRDPDGFHSVLDVEKYTKLIKHCNRNKISYGFDSCSANLFIESIPQTVKINCPEGAPESAKKYFKDVEQKNRKAMEQMAEPCESGMFSSYINCHGEFFVCSFAEGEDEWKEGIDVLNCDDFVKDIWNHHRLVAWRDRLIENKRDCPIYDLSLEKV